MHQDPQPSCTAQQTALITRSRQYPQGNAISCLSTEASTSIVALISHEASWRSCTWANIYIALARSTTISEISEDMAWDECFWNDALVLGHDIPHIFKVEWNSDDFSVLNLRWIPWPDLVRWCVSYPKFHLDLQTGHINNTNNNEAIQDLEWEVIDKPLSS